MNVPKFWLRRAQHYWVGKYTPLRALQYTAPTGLVSALFFHPPECLRKLEAKCSASDNFDSDTLNTSGIRVCRELSLWTTFLFWSHLIFQLERQEEEMSQLVLGNTAGTGLVRIQTGQQQAQWAARFHRVLTTVPKEDTHLNLHSSKTFWTVFYFYKHCFNRAAHNTGLRKPLFCFVLLFSQTNTSRII